MVKGFSTTPRKETKKKVMFTNELRIPKSVTVEHKAYLIVLITN